MHEVLKRALLMSIAAVMAGTVLVMGRHNRQLREEKQDLVKLLTEPHRGALVPSFAAKSLGGDTVTIGHPDGADRQVLFFFTTTCPYCQTSFPALKQLDSALQHNSVIRAKLFAVALDSPSVVRRFVDSTRISVLLSCSCRVHAWRHCIECVPSRS